MNIDTRLEELAPEASPSAERVAHLRAEVLSRALAQHRPERRWGAHTASNRGPRRLLVGGAVALACAAAVVAGPTLRTDTERFSANALTPLARAAEGTVVPPLSGGRVLHRVENHRMASTESGEVTVMQREEWTLEDGTYYRRETVDGKVDPVLYEDIVSASDFTPGDIAALPSEPRALLKALNDSPKSAGDDRALELEFARGLLGEIIYRGYAPTKVWAAAIEAYGSFKEVQVRVDVQAQVTFVTEIAKGGPLTMRFASVTGTLLGYESTSPQDGGWSDTMSVSLSRVEDGVPPEIVASARPASR